MLQSVAYMPMEQEPLISVVMPTYQQADFIEESIRSILEQDYKWIEIVVADGGSSDKTLDILKGLSRQNRNIFWESKEDNGPAQAINRAVKRSRGTIIGWLNSDDKYKAKAISTAVKELSDKPNLTMLYGHGEFIDVKGEVIGSYPSLEPQMGLSALLNGCFICQPTVFFKRSMFSLLGPLNEGLQASFDYDYWLRAFKSFPNRIGFIDSCLAQSRLHSDGISAIMHRQIALEGLKVTHEHLGSASPHWAITYLEEVSKQSVSIRGFEDFHDHAEAFLNEAKPYLNCQELEIISRSIKLLDSY